MFDLVQERDEAGPRIGRRTMVFLISHGQPEELNLEELGERGKQQTSELAYSRIVSGVSRIYSSPSKVTKQTADILKKEFAVQVDIKDCLSNVRLGKDMANPDVLSTFWSDPYAELKGCECIHEAQTRFGDCLNELVSKHPNDSIAVISHPLVITLFTSFVQGGIPQVEDWVYSGFCACSSYEVTKRSWNLVMPPDDSFLTEPCSVVEVLSDEIKSAFGI